MKTPCNMRQELPVVLVAGLGGLFTVVDVACAQPWAATTAPNLSWSALAASADGTRMVAAANTRSYGPGAPAPIYISTNAGASWAQTSAPSNNWSSVACSADGTKLVAVAAGGWGRSGTELVFCEGAIYSSMDSGAIWTRTSAPRNYWTSVASSADGARLVAVAAPVWVWNWTNSVYSGDGAIYRSLDSGATWTPTVAPTNYWSSVASSADGTRLVAVAMPQRVWSGTNYDYIGDGAIYRSLDSGATWTPTTAPSNNWTSVASSADGAKWVAVAEPYLDENGNRAGDGAIYSSLDSGATWNRTSAPSNFWSAVTSSADGTKLVAASAVMGFGDGDGRVYTSSDTGVTWMAADLFSSQWAAVACSADGYRVVAGGYYTSLYTLPYSGPWRLADAPAEDWTSVASSADGARLVAVAAPLWVWNGTNYDSVGAYAIYRSLDSGAIWTRTSAPTNYWTSVASSADGTKLVGAVLSGAIYTSSNSGATWARTTTPSNSWYSVASSADGAKLVAVAGADGTNGGDGLIYTSSNSGVTWTRTTAPSNRWYSVASSADGAKLVAAAITYADWGGDGMIYTSSNSGGTWTPTSAPTNEWRSVASSADGTKLVAATWRGIYTSSDSGVTWTQTTGPTNGSWGVASSADGTKLVAMGDGIYISTNSGATWTSAGAPAVSWWGGVTSSADGSNIVALGDGAIWTLRSPAPVPPQPPWPQLAVGLSAANLGLSWLVPSTRFVLQQNSDLGSTNWVEVPTSPTLDNTNLHQRLTLTPSLGSSYFRLKQQ